MKILHLMHQEPTMSKAITLHIIGTSEMIRMVQDPVVIHSGAVEVIKISHLLPEWAYSARNYISHYF